MYLNLLGKSFAQSIATAFRAAQWEVNYGTGASLRSAWNMEPDRGPRSL
jgi:hypothetical protein